LPFLKASDYAELPRRNASNSKACSIQRGIIRVAALWVLCRYRHKTHSTGHEKRLGRKTLTDLCPFGSTNYSKEELCAEMGAAYLCGIAGIENRTIDNSAAYIGGWLSKLRRDPKVLVQAAAQAQKAMDYIMAGEVADGTN
jgi:antirestriction protein ArdC